MLAAAASMFDKSHSKTRQSSYKKQRQETVVVAASTPSAAAAAAVAATAIPPTSTRSIGTNDTSGTNCNSATSTSASASASSSSTTTASREEVATVIHQNLTTQNATQKTSQIITRPTTTPSTESTFHNNHGPSPTPTPTPTPATLLNTSFSEIGSAATPTVVISNKMDIQNLSDHHHRHVCNHNQVNKAIKELSKNNKNKNNHHHIQQQQQQNMNPPATVNKQIYSISSPLEAALKHIEQGRNIYTNHLQNCNTLPTTASTADAAAAAAAAPAHDTNINSVSSLSSCTVCSCNKDALTHFQTALPLLQDQLGMYHKLTAKTYYWIAFLQHNDPEKQLQGYLRTLRIRLRIIMNQQQQQQQQRNNNNSNINHGNNNNNNNNDYHIGSNLPQEQAILINEVKESLSALFGNNDKTLYFDRLKYHMERSIHYEQQGDNHHLQQENTENLKAIQCYLRSFFHEEKIAQLIDLKHTMDLANIWCKVGMVAIVAANTNPQIHNDNSKSMTQQAIDAFRQALKVAVDDITLRRIKMHFSKLLIQFKYKEETIIKYFKVLSRSLQYEYAADLSSSVLFKIQKYQQAIELERAVLRQSDIFLFQSLADKLKDLLQQETNQTSATAIAPQSQKELSQSPPQQEQQQPQLKEQWSSSKPSPKSAPSTSKLELLKLRLEGLQSDHDSQVNFLKNQVAELKAQLKESKQQVKQQQQAHKSQVDDLQQKMTLLEAKHAQSLGRVTATLHATEDQLSARQQQVQLLQQENQELKKKQSEQFNSQEMIQNGLSAEVQWLKSHLQIYQEEADRQAEKIFELQQVPNILSAREALATNDVTNTKSDMLAIISTMPNKYITPLGTFVIRRPYGLDESNFSNDNHNDTIFFKGANDYHNTAMIESPSTLQVAAVVDCDPGSVLVLTGESNVYFKQAHGDNEWKEYGNVDSRELLLGWVTYKTADETEGEYSLDELLETAMLYRERYCESIRTACKAGNPLNKKNDKMFASVFSVCIVPSVMMAIWQKLALTQEFDD